VTGQTLAPAPQPAAGAIGTIGTTGFPQVGGVISSQVGGVVTQPYGSAVNLGATSFPAGGVITSGGVYGTSGAVVTGPVYGGATVVGGSPYGVIQGSTVVQGGATVVGGSYGGVIQGGPIYGGMGRGPSQSQINAQQLKAEANFQSRLHEYNSRVVKQASQDQTRLNLFDTILNPGGHSEGFALLRFRNQARTVDALRSEKRIAAKNADLAYQRYREDPSHLNLLVSKYSDLNEQLRDASLQYNTVNAGTFGQTLRSSFKLFGGSSLTSLLVSRQETSNLQDIQRRMQRIGRQITNEVQARARGSQQTQGATAQRLVAMNAYGPSRPF
jgi:hypothetical protein